MNTKGIIITGKSLLTENQKKLDLSGGIDDESLRKYLVYWDEIHFIEPSYFGGLNINDEKYKLLINEKILKTTVVKFPGEFDLFSPLALESREIAQLDYYSKINRFVPNMKFSIAQSGNILRLPTESKEQTNCVELSLGNLLPVPTNCSFEEILNFKSKRESELLSYRIRMNEFSKLLQKEMYSKDEFINIIEHIKKALIDIHKVMDETKFQKKLTSVRTFLNLLDPNAIQVLLPLFDELSDYGDLISLGVNTLLKLGIKKQNRIKGLPEKTQDFAYLYYLEELNKN